MSSELRRLWEQAGGKVPDDWKILPFESLFRDNKSIAVGVMYPGLDTPGGVPLLKVGDVKNGLVSVRPSYCISAATNEEHKRTQLVGDELLITLVGNPGECIVATSAMAGWNPARAIAVVRLHDTSLRTYLKAVLESTPGKHLIDAVLNTTVQKTLNLKDVRQLPIPLPSRFVIEEISSIANSLIQRIAVLRETNTTLEAIAQEMFKSWFVDFDPVHAKQQGRAPEGMDEATAALFPDSFEESELGLVPIGWEVKSLGDLLVPKRGKSITKSKCIDGDIPVVAGGLEPAYFHNQGNVCSPVVTISASGANAGFVRLYQQDIWASDCSFVSAEQTDATFFWYAFLKFNQDKIYSMQQGAAQPHIYPSDLMRLSISSPKSCVMRNVFNGFVSPLFESIGLANSKIKTLASLRDTLLPRLISGQLRLPEAEAVLEEATA